MPIKEGGSGHRLGMAILRKTEDLLESELARIRSKVLVAGVPV